MCFGVDASHWSNATITKDKIKVERTDLSDTETCKTCKTDHVLKAQLIYLYSYKFKNIEDVFEAVEDGMEGNGVHQNGRNTRRYEI